MGGTKLTTVQLSSCLRPIRLVDKLIGAAVRGSRVKCDAQAKTARKAIHLLRNINHSKDDAHTDIAVWPCIVHARAARSEIARKRRLLREQPAGRDDLAQG